MSDADIMALAGTVSPESMSVGFVAILDIAAKYVGIFSLLFATVTYWVDWLAKRKHRKHERESLDTELRTLYNAVRDDIIAILEIQSNKRQLDGYLPKHYHLPNSTRLINTGEYIKIFNANKKAMGTFLCMANVVDLSNELWKRSINPMHFDFILEKRLSVVRSDLLQLSRTCGFIDMSIVPKMYGTLTGLKETPEVIHDFIKEQKLVELLCERANSGKIISGSFDKPADYDELGKYYRDHGASLGIPPSSIVK